ncbi:MAG: glycosyltransferase family 2 protein [Candidatus Omnitrophica bacterium]|nr:glycosyltransferase family 2 protein [Candidatus Omnitrophota bacterium]
MGKCDIIIPVWNEPESTKKCIDRLKACTRYPYSLIVIDNGSNGPTRRYLESLKNLFSEFFLIRNDTNLGFVKAVNQGMKVSQSPYLCLLNNDAYVTDNWLTFLVETLESCPDNAGLASPTSNDFNRTSPDGARGEWQELDSCKGFCMLIKKEVITKLGFFDEIFEIGYFEEKDFSRRAVEAGYKCIRAKSSFVEHIDRLSFDRLPHRNDIFKKNEKTYNKRWGRAINVASVATNAHAHKKRSAIITELLRKGDRVTVFYASAFPELRFKDHIQMKLIPTGWPFFIYNVLFKIWERRNKKKIDIILTDDEKAQRFFQKMHFVHGSEILSVYDDRVLDICETKRKEC